MSLPSNQPRPGDDVEVRGKDRGLHDVLPPHPGIELADPDAPGKGGDRIPEPPGPPRNADLDPGDLARPAASAGDAADNDASADDPATDIPADESAADADIAARAEAPSAPAASGAPDEQLLDRYRLGDRAAFSALVERYHRELFHFLIRFLGDRAAAEDVFQETFLQVHQSAAQFDFSRRFRPWLFTIAANKARDLMRSQARRPVNPLQATINAGDEESGQFIDLMASAAEAPGLRLEKEEVQRLVHDTVMSMPDHLREILLLSYFHQFPYKQISDILGIPLGTVKSRLHAAVAYFADRWRASHENKTPAQ